MYPNTPQLPLDLRLEDHASFEGYHAGPNAEAVAALRAGAAGEGGFGIYLYGPSGLGKTHLLQAACRYASDAGRAVAYMPLREAGEWPVVMLDGLQAMDLVAVDDLQMVRARPDWQEALFHLFNQLRDSGRQMLFAADGRPGDLGLELPDLVSRLQWGLVLRLQEPADGDKIQGLSLRAAQRGLELPPEAGRYLLAHCPRDPAYLFDLLDKLDQASLMAKRRLTIPFIREILEG